MKILKYLIVAVLIFVQILVFKYINIEFDWLMYTVGGFSYKIFDLIIDNKLKQ